MSGTRRRFVLTCVVSACLLSSALARADDDDDSDDDLPPPPPGWDYKRPLTKADYNRKKIGGYVTGLPLANFDPNTGFGGGVRGYYYYNGPKDHPLFGYTPYLHRVFAQYFRTTKGLQFHWLDYDAPAFLDTPYRLRTQLIYMRNTQQHFYGLGNEAMKDLTFPGAGRRFSEFSDYQAALDRVRPDGTTLSRYDHYDLVRPIVLIGVERTYLRGLIRPVVGFAFTHTSITDYTGKRVEAVDADGNDVMAPMGTTRLKERCDAGELVGCNGGWDNVLRLGLAYDTRDFEPDPNSGIFADVSLELGTGALGGDYDYARFLASFRIYYSPIPDKADLVLATRLTFQTQSPGTPFFSLNTVPYTEDPRTGLGGIRTLRGYKQDRFIGHAVGLINTEVRWTFRRFQLWNQKFALIAVGFSDAGRVFDKVADFSLRNWRAGFGSAFRIAWNQATIVTFDYGWSLEDTGLYINFNHIF